MLNCYRKLIALRKSADVFFDGEYTPIWPEWEEFFAYRRSNGKETLTVIANFGEGELNVPADLFAEAGELCVSSYPDANSNVLRPYEARMYLKK